MSDAGPSESCDEDYEGEGLTEDDIAVLARSRLDVFAQYVLQNEQPDTTVDYDDADEAAWARALFSELASCDLDSEDGAAIELQPYHVDLLRALLTKKRLIVTAHTESGKTQIGIAYVLWALGRNPNLRVAVVSQGASLASLICGTLARYIADESFEGCRRLRRVFPDLLPGSQWSMELGFCVRRSGAITHPSFARFGAETGITGYRVDIALLDDYVTPKTTETPYLRAQQATRFNTTIINRLTQFGQLILFGNAQWSDDCAAQLAKRKGFHEFKMRVTKDGTPTGELEWPQKWPRWRILEACEQNTDHRAALFAERRQVNKYGRFDPDAIKAAVQAGRGRVLGARMEYLPPGATVCIGVDFAFTNGRKSDESAIVAILREAPAKGHRMGRRVLLGIDAGKWDDLTAMQRLEHVIGRYPKGRVRIRGESNAGQRWIVQSWTRTLGEMIEPYETNGSKWDDQSGIPVLAAAFLNGLWVLPGDEFGEPLPEVKVLIDQMGAFDPSRAGRDHTGDRLMALFFADGLARDLPPPSEARFGFVGENVTPELAVRENQAVAAAVEASRRSGPIPQPEDHPIPVRKIESDALWTDMRELLANRADGRPAY
mgnify:CR=1 FL=1